MNEPCCETMAFFLEYRCPDHPDLFDCPDAILCHDTDRDAYGIRIHDGGRSWVQIAYCPWCGKKL